MNQEQKAVLQKFRLDGSGCRERIPIEAKYLGDCLYVISETKDDWMEFVFLEETESQDGAIYGEVLISGCGYTGSLRECRHTWWGRDGYIFYPSPRAIRTALDWLETVFDM